MHDVAVALDEKLIRHLDGANRGNAADVVAAEIEQHQVLGPLFRIAEQFLFQHFVLMRRCSARTGAGNWADCDDVSRNLDKNFWARSRDGKLSEVEEIQIR